MIIAPVTEEKLKYWKQIWQDNLSVLKPNRISGKELNAYFQDRYSPAPYTGNAFLDAVAFNLRELYGEKAAVCANIACYVVQENVYVGLDLNTGFFQLESENIERCIPIYDDLYVKRGLNCDDLKNYVLTGQYLELLSSSIQIAPCQESVESI